MTLGQSRVVLAFGTLIVFCTALMVGGDFIGPFAGSKLSDAGADGLKMSISALVGALSALLGAKKG